MQEEIKHPTRPDLPAEIPPKPYGWNGEIDKKGDPILTTYSCQCGNICESHFDALYSCEKIRAWHCADCHFADVHP